MMINKNRMSNKTEEEKSFLIRSERAFLMQTSFKNVSGNWQFKGDVTPEKVFKIALELLKTIKPIK